MRNALCALFLAVGFQCCPHDGGGDDGSTGGKCFDANPEFPDLKCAKGTCWSLEHHTCEAPPMM